MHKKSMMEALKAAALTFVVIALMLTAVSIVYGRSFAMPDWSR